MTGYRDSSAYDFSLFEPQVAAPARKPQKQAGKTASKNTTQYRNAAVAPQKQTPARKQQPYRAGDRAIDNLEKARNTVDSFQVSYERKATVSAVNPAVKKALAYGFVCFCLLTCLLYMRSLSDKVTSQISTVKSQIDIAEGECVRLNAEMNSRISNEKIEKYAENVLGMVKAESYQITYLDLSEGDKVVLSGDKTVKSKETKEEADNTEEGASEKESSKLKELFAYIF